VVIKDVPMVDQGEKGYCVVAACERLFRYYGIKTDANELAQLANSSAMYGTSLQAMMESLKKLTAQREVVVVGTRPNVREVERGLLDLKVLEMPKRICITDPSRERSPHFAAWSFGGGADL